MREEISPKKKAWLERLAKISANRWKDPAFRKKVVEKQKALGYRTYAR